MVHLTFLMGLIFILSAIVSIVFGLVIFTLRRGARVLQEKNWSTPFAITFFVLAAIYILLFVKLLVTEPQHLEKGTFRDGLTVGLDLIVNTCSGITNYLFLLSAFRLSRPTVANQRRLPFKRWIGEASIRRWSLLILCLAGLLATLQPVPSLKGWPSFLVGVPDTVFSAIALLFLGLVLYQNISLRRDKAMARLALLSSISYAVLYMLYGFQVIPIIVESLSQPGAVSDALKSSELLMTVLSLFLKFGLFFPGYSLMLLVSGPLEGIERLLRNVTRNHGEYLEGGGLVKSIREELHLNSVRLYIRLPGLKENLIGLYEYPPSNSSDSQSPKKFKYEEDTDYDRVIKSGEPQIRNRDDYAYWFLGTMSEVTVPIFYHNSVIACLYAEIGDERFTAGYLSNFKRIATMVSPAVQSYREMAALNKISQDLTQLQIGVTEYETDLDLERITETIHNVVSPAATGVSMEIGFSESRRIHSQDERAKRLIAEQLVAELGSGDVTHPNPGVRFLKSGLTISMVDSAHQKDGEQVFGKFVLMSVSEDSRHAYSLAGTNATFRRAVSDVLTDTMLDFVRGYLNQLNDILGVRLSGLKGTRVEDWLKEVDKTAREASLVWVVAKCSDDASLVGDVNALRLVNSIDNPEQRNKWELKDRELWLYTFEQPQDETYHVIKKTLKDSQATLWLGVARRGFGRELDYVSPWKYFLDNFCKIADSSLLRILTIERQKRRMGEVQSIIAGTVTIGTVAHDLANVTRRFVTQATDLKNTQEQEERDDVLSELHSTHDEIERLLPKITDIYKRDLRRPCSLDEAVGRALERLELSLKNEAIKIEKEVPMEVFIDVPFDAAANALVTVIENATEAIRDRRSERNGKRNGEPGLITIKVQSAAQAEDADDLVACDITDNGLGVPKEVQDTLLKEISKSRKRGSHGVGLLFSLDLLRLHGGDIVLKHPGPQRNTPGSDQPDTTFSIIFPK